MKHDDVDPLREAKTNPAIQLTDRQMLESIQDTVADMAAAVRRLELNFKGTIEQGQSVNKRVSELEQRVAVLERGSMNGEQQHQGEST